MEYRQYRWSSVCKPLLPFWEHFLVKVTLALDTVILGHKWIQEKD